MLSTLLLSLATSAISATVPGTYVDSTTGFTVTYQGCYSDPGPSNRAMPLAPAAGYVVAGSLTVQACQLGCQANTLNPTYFGVEFGGECYCSNATSLTALTALTDAQCTNQCTGNSTQICGGSGSLSVYQQTPLTQIPTNLATGATYLGCQIPTATAYIQSSNVANVDTCIAQCSANGASFAAITNYGGSGGLAQCQCFAANAAGTFTASTGCTSSCLTPPSSGPASGRPQICGNAAASANAAWSTFQLAAPSPATALFAAGVISYKSMSGVTFNYLTCQSDSAGTRTLAQQIPLANVTIQNCIEAATGLGYVFAGLEAGTQCFGANTYTATTNTAALPGTAVGFTGYSALISSSAPYAQCNTACSGNSLQPCGGTNTIALYQAQNFLGFVPTYVDNKGQTISFLTCASDNATNSPAYRTFATKASLNASIMTPQLCSQACSASGFLFAGVEYAQECWCSSTAPIAAQTLPQYSCVGVNAMKCTGNSSLFCGGGNMMVVYKATVPTGAVITQTYVTPTIGTVSYVGCFADSTSARVLGNYFYSSASAMTVESCVSSCYNLGFVYAGLGTAGGQGCFCAAQMLSATTSTSCNVACSGNSLEFCGSATAVQVYSYVAGGPSIVGGTNAANVVVAGTDPSTPGSNSGTFVTQYSTAANYIGCSTDSAAARIMSTKATTVAFNVMTPKACVDACTLIGMPYSGVEWAQECWCNAVTPPAASLQLGIQCNMPCTGNSSLACGNGNRIALYYNGGVSTISYLQTVNSYTLRGCFADSIGTRTLRNRMSLNYAAMTPAVCTAACANAGYYYAGLEYAGECWCDNSIQNGQVALASNATCGMPCTGQAGAYCGGGNAINVYYNPALIRSTLQTYTTTGAVPGKVWNYKACWGEPAGGRGLPNPLNNAAQYTVGSCLELGSAAGYNACGLEYGGECWCASIAGNPGGGQIPESYCTTSGMVCKGNSLNYCGAGNVFSFYSTGTQSYTLM